jgi:hypothetical protein
MNNQKKVGCVVIMHAGQCNYGSSLQGYATIKKVADLGYDYEIIRYNKTRSLEYYAKNLVGLLRSGAYAQWKYMQKKKQNFREHPEFARTRTIRTTAVDAFKKRYMDCVSHFYNSYKELQEGSKDYSVVFVGSDQVWGPLSLYSRFYNLYFVDDSVPKFSYASSFGVSEIFPWQRKGVAGYLNRMNMIGVREQRGKEIVKELTGKDAMVVCDPTFLLTQQEWLTALEENEKSRGKERNGEPYSINEPYILTYVLGEREDVREQIKKLRAESGLKVVNLPHIDNYHAMDDDLGDISLYDVDPFDFIRLVRDAKYVVTDSFHGSVFSILMHKKFLTFYRKPSTEKGHTNSRIDSLFSLFGLSDRLFHGDIYGQIKQDIDYRLVDEKVEGLRAQSLEFFKKGLALSGKQSK